MTNSIRNAHPSGALHTAIEKAERESVLVYTTENLVELANGALSLLAGMQKDMTAAAEKMDDVVAIEWARSLRVIRESLTGRVGDVEGALREYEDTKQAAA